MAVGKKPSRSLLAQAASWLLLVAWTVRAQSSNTPVIPGASSYNGLNLVPQMGWDNWNAYSTRVSEDLLLSTAKSIVDFGLRDLGYNYVVLDDAWSSGRNGSGYLVADETKFPHGIKYIADKLNDMGLKFGMYSSAGVFTCAKYPGSLGHETKDADFFATNDVSYLKYDNCFNQGQSGTPQLSFNRYNVMSKALNATGREILYSMCNWGDDNPFDWAYTIANSGRMSGDIYDSFNRPDAACPCATNPCNWPGYHCSVMNIIEKMAPIQSRTMSGYFNDMDALEVGNAGMNDNEYVAHFTMWAILSSPLIMGTNVPNLSPSHYSILANPAVIAINQDPTATAAARIWKHSCTSNSSLVDEYGQCDTQLWVRTLNNSDVAVAMLNNANGTVDVTASLADIFIPDTLAGTSTTPMQLSEAWDVFDLWGNRLTDTEASSILNGTSASMNNSTTAMAVNGTMGRLAVKTYNISSDGSYADGLNRNDTRLFGKKLGTLNPGGVITTEVPRHGIAAYRLRRAPSKEVTRRDEL
ncbi:MAG: hypothetical protein M1828_005761 [Chrysothrix sp. TS-e1954]|nr:MAG: hypothetical protein M1828_005761 [Chrysothrix sp. TS-e1954]